MRKILLLAFGILVSVPVISQDSLRIPFPDLTIPKYSAGVGTFKTGNTDIIALEVEPNTTYEIKKVIPSLPVQAESGTLTNAQADPSTNKTTVCCLTPGAVLAYPNAVLNGFTKLTVRYSKGSGGTGIVTLHVGSINAAPITLAFLSTGSWTTFKDVTFTITQSGTGFWIKSSTLGPLNVDSFIFTR